MSNNVMHRAKFILFGAFVLVAGGIAMPQHAQADTFCVQDPNIIRFEYVMEHTGTNCLALLTLNLDKSGYQPGETITVTGSVRSSACSNRTRMDFDLFVYIPGISSESNVYSYRVERYYGGDYNTKFGTYFFTNYFTAPSAGGNYTLKYRAKLNLLDAMLIKPGSWPFWRNTTTLQYQYPDDKYIFPVPRDLVWTDFKDYIIESNVDVPFSVNVPPDAPFNAVGMCDASTHTATMSWSVPEGTKYSAWRLHDMDYPLPSSCEAGGAGLWCVDDNTNSPKILGGLYGSQYHWWVHACNDFGCSAPAEGSFSCLSGADTAGSCADTTMNLHWNIPAGATNTRLRVDDLSSMGAFDCNTFSPGEVCLDAVTSPWSSTAGIRDHRYHWWVESVVGGNTVVTEGGEFTCTVPPPPTNGVGSCSADGLTGTFSWTPPAGYTHFVTGANMATNMATDGTTVPVPLPFPAWDYDYDSEKTGKTSISFTTTPGRTYGWWVFTKDLSNNAVSPTSVGGTFTCTAPTPIGSIILQSNTCLIPAGATTCSFTMGWETTNVYPNTAIPPALPNGGVRVTFTPEGGAEFDMYHDGSPHDYPNGGGWYYAGTHTIRLYDTKTKALLDTEILNITPPAASNVDLRAGSISPTSVSTAGQAVIFSSTIYNTGSQSVNSNFTALFQSATNSSGAGATDIGEDTISPLSAVGTAGASEVATFSFAFPTSGEHYMRACADESLASPVGIINESDESNNCGPWTKITVGAQCPVGQTGTPPMCLCPANYTMVGTTCQPIVCPAGYIIIGNTCQPMVCPAGQIGTPPSCSCPAGYTLVGGTCQVVATPPTIMLNANPKLVRRNTTTALTWSATNVTTCSLSGPSVSSSALSGSLTPTITGQSVFTLACTGNDGSHPATTTTVNLIPGFEEL